MSHGDKGFRLWFCAMGFFIALFIYGITGSIMFGGDSDMGPLALGIAIVLLLGGVILWVAGAVYIAKDLRSLR